jgi:hypothetical protein
MPFRRPLLAGSVLVVALASAACGAATGSAAPSASATAAPSTAPATDAPSPSPEASEAATAEPTGSSTAGRTGRIELPDDKVAITLPDGWVEVVLTGDDIETILSAFPEGTFDESQTELMRTAMQAGMRLMAFDSAGTGSNVSVLVQDVAMPVSLLKVALPAQLQAIPGASAINVEDTTAMGEDALIATYDLETTLADGTTTKGSGTQLYVSANGKLYVVTVTLTDGDSEDAKAILETFEQLP